MQVKMQTHIFVKQGSHVPVSCFIYALVNVPYCLYFWHQNVKNRIIQTVVYELHQAVVTPRQLAWLILIAIWTSTSLPSGCSLLLWWRCQQRYPSKHQEGQPLSINQYHIESVCESRDTEKRNSHIAKIVSIFVPLIVAVKVSNKPG